MSDESCVKVYKGFIIDRYTDEDALSIDGESKKLYQGNLNLHSTLNDVLYVGTNYNTSLSSIMEEINALYEKYPFLEDARRINDKLYDLIMNDDVCYKYHAEFFPASLKAKVEQVMWRKED